MALTQSLEIAGEAAVQAEVAAELRPPPLEPDAPWAVQMTEGRGLPAGGTSAPGRVVEPPGTPYLPDNLPATPPEWSSNSDDSE